MCWFDLVITGWVFLSNSQYPITDNETLSNNPYFWGLLSNLEDILIPVDAISIMLGIFDPVYPSRDVIPLGELDYF